ncbi:division plane positioning ATPase MipZ [Elioraea thermophila]|uniref:division plane positioning ATPase MipZ n=1 Tax=Elioraea thermophila TaxID=2185104 RepID=UPI001E5AFF0F|nr:division plane positioning ATPase MipZ [Elioraea thermophila]
MHGTLPTPRVTLDTRPHILVLGNEKGGSGKSTAAMHVIVGLLRDGYRVGAIDLDARQATLTRYLEARAATAAKRGVSLPLPASRAIHASRAETRREAEAEDEAALSEAIAALAREAEFVVIDCPGADTYLARRAHALADTLITPINDSFVDFSMLAIVDPDDRRVVRPSVYAELVWEARKARFARDRGRLDWIVMRNRLGAREARNQRDVGATLEELAKRIGFRTVRGFGERVIFRELYLQGLTLMDLKEAGIGGSLTMSHVAARQEVRTLLAAIRKGPPGDVWGLKRAGAAVAPLAPADGAA